MIKGFQEVSAQRRKIDGWLSFGFGLLAAGVYGLTVSRGVYPGESARLMAICSGIETAELPLHPVWGTLAGAVSRLSFFTLPVRMNLLSVVCGVIAVMLLYLVMAFLIRNTLYEEYSIEYAPRVATLAASVTVLAFLFSVPMWKASTRLHYQSFDILLALVSAYLLVCYANSGWRLFLVVFAVLQGIGVVESVLFIPLAPVFLVFLIYVLWKREALTLTRVAWIGVLAVAGLSLYYVAARRFLDAQGSALGFSSVMDVLVQVWKNQIRQLRSGLPRVGWLVLILMSVVPWVASGLTAFRALNNERSWSQYILHITLSVLVVLGLANAEISPWEIIKPTGRLPVCSYLMLSMTAGYLVAYWYLLLVVKRPRQGHEVKAITQQTGDWLGLIFTYPLALFVVLAALINAFECGGQSGAFADRCAREVLDRLDGRTWFVTDGTLDPHLQILARERGQELNLLCLQKDMSPHYLQFLAKMVEEKQMFEPTERQRMKNTLELGVLPFIQDWFAMDREIEKKVAVFGVPDFWYTAGITPVPEFFFFSGCRDIRTLQDRPLLEEYKAFWKEMDVPLARDKKGSDDPTVRLRAHLRRHMGFVANNLGVLLEDLGKDAEAFAVYTIVHDQIDPDNVSAMFNRFEMARRGVSAANPFKESIERELKDFIGNLKQKYPLWSLSRYYGYVRSPEIFARLGWGWALSGQTGAALAGVTRAINLLPTDQRINAMQAMAAVYALSEDRNKTEAVYQDIIRSDPKNRAAMLGLARLAVRDGALDKAKQWLEKAAQSDDRKGSLGVEWAVIHLMNNDIGRARLALQELTDLQPKNLQAWAMLAMVQLQQKEDADVEKVILPKMESIAGTPDDYFIQITRAQVAMRKGKNFQRVAREGFIRASMLRPDIPGVKDMILELDIAMNDQEAAELHARQVLRVNRKHALANYVMGSLRLQEGAYGEAEDFLRRSVEAKPSAAALNDLAEVLRRIRRFDDAEAQIRAAIKMNAELYVAWETLGAILLDAGKDLDEAERAVNQAISLYADDLRVKITLARILLKKGEIERARETIRLLRNRQGELSRFDQEVLARLVEEASGRKAR